MPNDLLVRLTIVSPVRKFELDVSFGLIAPKGLEPAVATRVHDAFKKALQAPSVRALIEKYNMVPSCLDGPAFMARRAGSPPT